MKRLQIASVSYAWIANGSQLDNAGTYHPTYSFRFGNEIKPRQRLGAPPCLRVRGNWRIRR